jgi:biopolymer transport protein ExbB
MMSAYSAVSHGHSHPELVETLVNQSKKLAIASRAFYTEPLADYIEKLSKLSGFTSVLPMNTGAEAVETAIKAARRWGYLTKGVEEEMTKLDVEAWLEAGNNPDNFQCAFEPKCLDECNVPYGDNSSCTDSCGVINGDGSSCIEIKEESAIVKLFREGGTGFMMCVLICLILGLAICIERIIYLMMASSNSTLLLSKIENELKNGQLESAKDVCRNTAGPTASICLQGLERSNESIESIEKSIMAYGSVQMGLLEKGTSWISLFIAIAPMLGFMGTVIGMIGAFNSIEAAGDISPSLVAGGIKQALLTTVFGLIVAIILQIFYNFIISKIDDIVNDMEDTSIALVDLIASNKK